MSDIADRASELEEAQRQNALDRQRRSMQSLADSAARCRDCGIAIPIRRRQAVPGCIRCTD